MFCIDRFQCLATPDVADFIPSIKRRRTMRMSIMFASLGLVGALAACGPKPAETKDTAAAAAPAPDKAETGAGALTPTTPTTETQTTDGMAATTAPSGADRTVRSDQCNKEADKRGLKDNDRKAFRLNCMATAAPVSAAASPKEMPTPTHDKPELAAEGIAKPSAK
jgi:hypothetical protein